jgi:hypothetical protein
VLRCIRRGTNYFVIESYKLSPPNKDKPLSDEDREANKKKILDLMEGLPLEAQEEILRLAEEMVRFNQGG